MATIIQTACYTPVTGKHTNNWTCPLCLLIGNLIKGDVHCFKIWLQNMTPPFPVSSYRNFIFAFDRMNLLSLSSFPCAKLNNTLIINSIPLDYFLTVFIILPPSHHSPSFSTWNLPRSPSLSSPLVTLQTGNGCLLGWSTVLVCLGLRLVVGWFWDHWTLSFKMNCSRQTRIHWSLQLHSIQERFAV